MHDGTVLDLPPILFGTLGNDKNKKTLLVYGHLDVQPAAKEDGWDTEPFELVEKVIPPFFLLYLASIKDFLCWRDVFLVLSKLPCVTRHGGLGFIVEA